MTTIYIQIGMEKTGTTSIQQYCLVNFDQLKAAGILYLKSTRGKWHNSWKFAAFFQEDRTEFLRVSKASPENRPFEGFLTGIKREVDEAVEQGINTLLISSEHLYSRLKSESEIAALADYLHQHFDEVKIIFWAREQISLLESAYSTALRVGERATIEEFFDKNYRIDNPYLNFGLGLQYWEAYFGRGSIVTKIYEEEVLGTGGIEARFMNELGVDTSTFNAIERKNESLPGTAAKALWLANNEFSLTEDERRLFIESILELRLPDSEFGKISEQNVNGDLFSDSNAAFFEKFNKKQRSFPKFEKRKLDDEAEVNFEALFYQLLLNQKLSNASRVSLDFNCPLRRPSKSELFSIIFFQRPACLETVLGNQ